MERTKAIFLVVLALLGMIIVLQNTETVETRLLFWSISMPRAVLLLGTSLIGFAAGIVTSLFLGKEERHRDYPEPKDKVKP